MTDKDKRRVEHSFLLLADHHQTCKGPWNKLQDSPACQFVSCHESHDMFFFLMVLDGFCFDQLPRALDTFLQSLDRSADAGEENVVPLNLLR